MKNIINLIKAFFTKELEALIKLKDIEIAEITGALNKAHIQIENAKNEVMKARNEAENARNMLFEHIQESSEKHDAIEKHFELKKSEIALDAKEQLVIACDHLKFVVRALEGRVQPDHLSDYIKAREYINAKITH